ncbi:hypothetical protein [Variovorax sp. RCC_210]|uniref:hypothetical protein n=1 Tax=Variovorax sp. RCC_210 TaxID=3239217 RepID=UPI0035238D2E
MFISIALALFFLGALLQFFAGDRGGEGSPHVALPQAAQMQRQQGQGTGSGPGPHGSGGTSADAGSVAPLAASGR